MKSDIPYLDHLLEAIRRIETFTVNGRDEFLASELVQDATLRNLQTIAESTKRLSVERRATEPDVPWRQIVGFRNVLVHEYERVDLIVVWQVVSEWLPPLKDAVGRMLSRSAMEPSPKADESPDK